MYQDIAVARGPTYDTLNARMDKCQQNIETMSDDIQRLQVTGLMGLESSAANDPSVWLDAQSGEGSRRQGPSLWLWKPMDRLQLYSWD